MIQAECTVISSPPGDQKRRWDLRVFPSPAENYALKFSDPQEFRMGAYGWKLTLLKEGADITKEHPKLTELTQSSLPGVPCPNPLQPWNNASSTIAIPSWDPCVHLYNVKDQKTIASPKCGNAWIILWSPHSNQFLSSTLREHFLVAGDGSELIRLNLKHFNLESPSFFWLAAKPWLGILSRETANSKPELRFLNEQTGNLQDTLELNPEQFVPYDVDKFRRVSRERYSLQVSKGHWAVGSLVDMWRFQSFDATTNSLYLSIYRPLKISKEGLSDETVSVEEIHVKFNLSLGM